MSLLRADKIANRFNNSGPIIVGPSTVSGNFTVTGILTALGIGVTNNVLVGGGLTTKFLTATNSASLFNSSLTGITTAGIITNATYFGDGVNLTGIVTEIQPGPGIQISPISGKGKLTISANGVVVSGYSTNSGLATDVKGGTAGAILYQAGSNDTAFTASGTAGEILQSQGTGTPVWTSLAAINVSYADSAGISTNLKGGSSGRIPYQSGQNQTAFLPIGPTGNLLLGQGTAAPNWIDPKANLDVRYARLSGISTSAIGGVVDTNSLIVTGITTLTGGNVVVDNDLRVTGVTTAANMVVTGVSTIATLKVGTGVGATVGVTTILNEDTFASNSDQALATQQSIKAYVDNAAGNVSLEYGGNIGTSSIDLDGERFDILGKVSEIYTIGTGLTITVGLDTNVTIPNNLTVTNQTQLSGITTVTGNLGVTGLTSTQFLDVSGVATVATLGVTGVTTTQFLDVTGVSTIATLGVTGVTTTKELIVTGVSSLTGSLIVSGITTLASDGGITTTGGDLYVAGNLNVVGDLVYDEVTGRNLNITGVATIANLGVAGLTTTKDLLVTGVSTLTGFSTFLSDVYISGITSVGAAVTMYPTTGIVSATAFYGDGSNLTGVVGLVSVTNQIYVTPDGNDENDGYLISTAKRTVGSALTIAEASSVIRISAGNYSENNPIIIPEQVTLLGDSLREVSIIPQNPDEDLIYVANGNYVENMSFTGSLNEGKAIIAFNPNKPSYVTQGPYIRNCTNFISKSIGMKIDGRHVIGDTRAMNVDSYTQLNQGGIGVSISNEGYAQLVSIFTIYNDQSIVCINGGQCDLTNSNSSFGRLGLVADGVGPTNFIGTVTQFTSAGSNVFPIDIGVDSINVTNATYDNVTGLTTITTATNHGYNVGMSVSMRNLKFSCDSKDVVREVTTAQQVPFSVSAATYTQSTGIMTVTTTANHNFNRRSAIDLNQLVFQCNSGGGPSTAFFPPAGGGGNGPSTSRFIVDEIPANNQFVVDVGISTIAHTYVNGGTSTLRPSQFGVSTAVYTASTGIMTVTTSSDHNLNFKTAVNLNNLVFRCNSGGGFSTAFFPPAAGDGNGATTSRFSVQEIPDDNQFVVNVGVSTINHEFVEGGTATNTPYYGITTATYNNITGVMTISTDVEHNVVAGISVTMTDLVFRCDSGGGPSTAFFPPALGDGNGAVNHVFDVISVGATNITVNVGPSTITHSYIDGGQVAISTISSFPNGSFGNIFTVDTTPSANQFTAYVGVSTYPSLYHSGGQVETFTSLPYDGQVVYLDEIYNTIKGVKITSGGSGYTSPPTVTFSDPSESWGVKATGVARLTGGSVTSVDMISNGRGYTGTPTVTFTGSATGTPDVLPTYYVVSSATPVVGGITTVTFTENVPYAVGVGTTVPFFKQSRVLASSQAFEYIGSGNTALTALPQRGGIAIPENEIVNKNGGLVIFTSTDQAGNFKIGEGVIINQLEGSITGDAYNRSLFANITPYILALGGDS